MFRVAERRCQSATRDCYLFQRGTATGYLHFHTHDPAGVEVRMMRARRDCTRVLHGDQSEKLGHANES